MFADKVFERYSVKRIALRQSPCGIPNVVVNVFPFVLLFFTCCVTSSRRIFIMLNSSESRISEIFLYKCSLLMVSNAFVISSRKMWVE